MRVCWYNKADPKLCFIEICPIFSRDTYSKECNSCSQWKWMSVNDWHDLMNVKPK